MTQPLARPHLVLFPILLVALLVLAPSALAVTVQGGDRLLIDEPVLGNNALTVTGGNGAYTVTDTAVPPIAGTGCAATANPNAITCTLDGDASEIEAFDMIGTDAIVFDVVDLEVSFRQVDANPTTVDCRSAVGCFLQGGGGNDSLTGGPDEDSLLGRGGDDTLLGGPGEDSLSGGAGNDVLGGGDHDDTMRCELGNDQYDGGAGRFDIYTCAAAKLAVTITLDGVANDGATGETDNVRRGFEVVTGSRYADRITGSAASDDLRGGAGDDVLSGLAGDDEFAGGDGKDSMTGGTGDDSFEGGAGGDTYAGGAGHDLVSWWEEHRNVRVTLDNRANDGVAGEGDNARSDVEDVETGSGHDRITGSRASNEIFSGGGNDVVVGLAGDDLLDGGKGNDTITGGTGRDELFGGWGRDLLVARDGARDLVDCGRDADRFTSDGFLEFVYPSCERRV